MVVPQASDAAPSPATLNRALSLQDAMQLAAKHNLELLQERLERRRRALDHASAMSTFLPQLTIDSSYNNSTPFDTTLPRDQRLVYGASVSWTAPVGTRLAVGVTIDQRLTGQTQQSAAINTANHSSNLGLSLTQPLLKGAGRVGAAKALSEAKLDAEIQRQLFREQLNELLARVEAAYWALAYSQVEVSAKERARDRARRQFEDTKENIRRGIIADIELYLVEENLVFFQQELVSAEQRRSQSQRSLAKLLQVHQDSKLSAKNRLSDLAFKLPAPQNAIRRGLQGNPTLAAQQLRLEKERVRLSFEKNQALPSLDLVGSFRLNGLDSDYAEHLSQVATAKRPEFLVGLNLALPLSFSAYRARVSQAQLAAEKQLLKLKQQEVEVRHDAALLIDQLAFTERRLVLAKRRVALSQLKLDAEVKKYKNGISTLDSIVRFQREQDQAALGVWRIEQELRTSRSRLLALSGALHGTYGIHIAD